MVAAACAGTLVTSVGEPVREPQLAEASGVTPTAGRTWTHNDSGGEPQLFGMTADGSTQVVTVEGADAVDWEDLTVLDDHLWIADTGDNARSRTSVQLYRVPVPAEGQDRVDAERVDVTYPDGAHDVEAVAADPGGQGIFLLTKFESPTLLFRVDPPVGGGVAEAEALGPVPLGGSGIATSMAIAPGRDAIAVRTYESAWLWPLAPDQPVAEALAAEAARCQAPAGTEAQGEAIGFLPDGSGYVTIGEGAAPAITTFTASTP